MAAQLGERFKSLPSRTDKAAVTSSALQKPMLAGKMPSPQEFQKIAKAKINAD